MKIAFPHPPSDSGGPGTFQTLIEAHLRRQGHEISYRHNGEIPDVVLVVGGTRHIRWLKRCRESGARIIHRLDGINWRHKVQWRGPRAFLLGAIRNRLISHIRNKLAHFVVYQSEFVQTWWVEKYGMDRCEHCIIHNGTDIDRFHPADVAPQEDIRLLIVEGNLETDRASMQVLTDVSHRLIEGGIVAGIDVFGGLCGAAKRALLSVPGLKYRGVVGRDQMPEVYRRASIFLSLEINGACPNTVIEAMASGLPVVGYDTGALPELVPRTVGRIARYGGNPWKIEAPDVEALTRAVIEVTAEHVPMASSARELAESEYSSDEMTRRYVNVFENLMRM